MLAAGPASAGSAPPKPGCHLHTSVTGGTDGREERGGTNASWELSGLSRGCSWQRQTPTPGSACKPELRRCLPCEPAFVDIRPAWVRLREGSSRKAQLGRREFGRSLVICSWRGLVLRPALLSRLAGTCPPPVPTPAPASTGRTPSKPHSGHHLRRDLFPF